MVKKTPHRGVHSGNTLRAFNSRFSRRYQRQACLVPRAHADLVQKLEAETAPSKLPPTADDRRAPAELRQPQNLPLGVALSLNKQARWLLPSVLIRQIQSDDIADPGLTVSVLERHKLKRPASCVSFHSNRGEVKRIQPRNGRYFSFQFPRPDGKSRRAARREAREKMDEELKRKIGTLREVAGTVKEVFTEQGSAASEPELGESEVRYEVYYPTPASSSISHNPKYIKQDMNVAFEDSDEHVQHGKPRKQHRGKRRMRMTLRDIDDWEPAAGHGQHFHTLNTFPKVVDKEEFSLLHDSTDKRDPTECLLTSLIEKAQKVQSFKDISKCRRKKHKCHFPQEHDKSHIVYLSESQEQSAPDEKPDEPVSSPLPPVSPIPVESTRVLLPKEDVTPAGLKDCFGECYTEVGCQPRKFVLDITCSVRELLKKQGVQVKVAEKTEEALSYLICIHDGFYDDEYDVYRLLLNSRLHKGVLTVEIHTEEQRDLFRGTVMSLISRTMDFMQGLVITLKQKNHFPVILEDKTASVSPRHLSKLLGSSEIYVPTLERVIQMHSAISDSDVAIPAVSDLLQEEQRFCDVCYDDISPLTYGSTPSTSLATCKHHVCDSCWSQHIHVRLHEGFVRLTCPGYDCQQVVKVGVLLSIVPLDIAEKLLQRQEEVRIGASQTEKWCPNETCGRVISLQQSSSTAELQLQQDVVCACGTHVCFQCLTPAHWPASCQQAEDYRAGLATAVFPDRLDEVHDDFKIEEQNRLKRELEKKRTMLVEGKHCPSCKSFVFKNGGCPQMTCRCGQLFCWYCAKPGFSHPGRVGCISEESEKKLTTTIVVHHLNHGEDADETKKQQLPSSANRRQRMSLMEKAVQHRQQRQKPQNSHAITTLAKAVAAAAAKNKDLTQHVARACSGASALSSQELVQTSIPSGRVKEMVSTFLRNASHSKQEVLEVVEYTLVLLKDLPDSLLRRRALRISDDLGAFCTFTQSIFDVWGTNWAGQAPLQEAVKAVMRLSEIQSWMHKALDSHIVTVRKLRSLNANEQ